jgi:hypothetical protein
MPSHDDDVSRHYHVVVIGAGPAGEAAAELGGNLGYPVALVERNTCGGTVITSGGAPTKTFREAAVYLSSFGKDKIYGIALSAPPEVMYPAVRARARQVSEQLRRAALGRIRERGVHLVHGAARLDGEHTLWPPPPTAPRRGCTPSTSSSRPGPARCAQPACPLTTRASLTPRASPASPAGHASCMNGIAEAVRQVRGTSVNQVPGDGPVLVTAGTGVPTSGLILSLRMAPIRSHPTRKPWRSFVRFATVSA